MTGGTHGVLDIGLLASAVARSQATFSGEELYGDVFAKTAALMESLTRKYPFVDGNKRTGITAAALFLRQNGWRLRTSNKELESFTLRVADEHPPFQDIVDWLPLNSIPLE